MKTIMIRIAFLLLLWTSGWMVGADDSPSSKESPPVAAKADSSTPAETPPPELPAPDQPSPPAENPPKGKSWSLYPEKKTPLPSAESTPPVEKETPGRAVDDAASAPAQPTPSAKIPVLANPANPHPVFVVPIKDAIQPPMTYILRRAVKEANEDPNAVLLLDIKTPGGRLDVTLEMMELLSRFKGEALAFVNDEAISAGAYISVACDEIYYAPHGVIGAAAVVSGGGEDIDETMKLKINSYLNAKVRSIMEKDARRAEVIKAMMDEAYELKIDDQVLKPSGELLTLTAEEAMKKYGEPPRPLFGGGIYENADALLKARYGEQGYTLRKFEITWSENLAQYIANITPVLIALGVIFLYLEFQTPGFGIFGALGITMFLIVFAGSFVIGLAGYEPLILFGFGVILIVVEIFLFPGMAIFLSLGVICVLVSLIWALADVWPALPSNPGLPGLPVVSASRLEEAITQLGIALGLSAAGIIVAWKFLPHTSRAMGLVAEGAITSTATSIGDSSADQPLVELPPLGSLGRAVSDLRPGGDVEIAGRRYRAALNYGMAKRGETVQVIGHSDLQLIVTTEITPNVPTSS